MMPIDLQPIPRYECQFVGDNQQYDIRVWFDGDDMMFMDVDINGVTVATSQPCLVGQQVIPYDYLEGLGGNFFWSTVSGGNPMYTNFGTSDILLYATAEEMETGRATNAANATKINLASNQAN